MVDLVLDDLRGKSCVTCGFPCEAIVLKLHADGLVASGRSRSSEQGETAFLRLKDPRLAHDLGIIHHGVSAVIIECDDPFGDADHIRCHADARFTVRHERVEKIPPDEDILLCRSL